MRALTFYFIVVEAMATSRRFKTTLVLEIAALLATSACANKSRESREPHESASPQKDVSSTAQRLPMAGPRRIRIQQDDSDARWVGRTADGLQFFVTTPFVPALRSDPGREFIAVYVWDRDGAFRSAKIDDLGPRQTVDEKRAKALLHRRIAELGKIERTAIEIAPFVMEHSGIRFGLVPMPPEEDDDKSDWSVIAEPGNYMMFVPPWDGSYDT